MMAACCLENGRKQGQQEERVEVVADLHSITATTVFVTTNRPETFEGQRTLVGAEHARRH